MTAAALELPAPPFLLRLAASLRLQEAERFWKEKGEPCKVWVAYVVGRV
jgi:hypothetical protein